MKTTTLHISNGSTSGRLWRVWRGLAAVAFGLALGYTAQATLLLEDHFSYPNGNLGATGIGDTVWTSGDSPSAAIRVTNTAALSYPGLTNAAGSGLVFSGTTFKKRSAPFAGQTAGTVYCSFLLNIQSAPAEWKLFLWLHNAGGGTSSPGLGLFLKGSQIGLAKSASSPTATTGDLGPGTHLIVARYSFLSGNDQVDVWVNPTSLGDNGNIPVPTLTTGTGSSSDISTLSYIVLNHGISQTLWIDEIRVGTTWADVTPSGGTPPPPPRPAPVIASVAITEEDFVLSGTNGPANADYDVLTSTNVALPLSQWTVVGTDSFDPNGNFTFASSMAQGAPQKFYVVRVASTNPPPVKPTITVQPRDTTNLLGNTATFSVSATGTPPLSYQWYFNSSTPLSYGTNATLTLTNVQFSDAGGYSVVVSNIAGAVTSVVAQLFVTNVETPPFIISQPQSRTVAQGQTVNFSVLAGGSMPLYYQWYFNSITPLANRTNATLVLTNVTTSHAGGYSVTVSNAFGITNSATATLTVDTNVPPDFSAIGFCNGGGLITGGAAGPTVYVGSVSELEAYSDVNPPYTIYITNSFNLSGMSTHIRPNKTVIGLGNVVLSGGGLYLYKSTNVIIRNLTIRNSTEDNIGIHYSTNIWIDHCTFIDATDGQLDITQASDNITVSWCKFYYTANPPAPNHRFVSLIAANDGEIGSYRVTYHHNWWGANCVERMPSVRFGRVHCFNNFYDAPGNSYCIRTRIQAECLVENNFFQNVQNPWEQYITSWSHIQGKLYASGNNVGFLDTSYGVTWTGTVTNKDGTIRMMIPGTDTVFTPPYSYVLDPVSQVPFLVTNYAGAGKGPFAP